MQPLAVDLQLLRAVIGPELRIAPGRAVMARVVWVRATGRGALSIAGTVIEAELPKHLRAGQELRLVVREVSAERVVLSLSDQAPASAPPPIPVRLPGGGTVSVGEREQAPGRAPAAGSHVVALRYDAPTLGPVDLRFELDPGTLRVAVTVAAGEPLQRAEADLDTLRRALADSVERAVSVTVSPRREPVEVYA